MKLTLKSPLPPTQILRGVTGELKAGRLTAIMGPSGAFYIEMKVLQSKMKILPFET